MRDRYFSVARRGLRSARLGSSCECRCGAASACGRMRVVVCVLGALALCSPLAVGKQARVDIHLEAAPGETLAGDLGRLRAAGAGFLAAPGVGGGEFDRETQSPMVWLNLHKSAVAPSSSSQSFGAYAAQRVAELKRRL